MISSSSERGGRPNRVQEKPGQAVDLDQDLRQLGLADRMQHHAPHWPELRILGCRPGPGKQDGVILDPQGAERDRLRQGREAGGERCFEALQERLAAT